MEDMLEKFNEQVAKFLDEKKQTFILKNSNSFLNSINLRLLINFYLILLIVSRENPILLPRK